MKCAVCFEETPKSCAGCNKVHYCCLAHQKADWKKHKNVCAPYSVSVKNGVNVLTLRKNVPKGTILLEETPLFHVPESNGVVVDSICLVCGVHMIPLTAKRCSVCKWPVCGTDCELHFMHKDNECNILASSKVKYQPKMVYDLSSILTQIRAIGIKTIYPNIWNDLNSLLVGTTPFDDEWKSTNGRDYRKVNRKFLPNSGWKEREEAISNGLTLRKVLMRSAFYFNAQDTLDSIELICTGKWRSGFYVYKKASLATHSCVPNCVWNISNFPHFKIRLRAAHSLVKGQILSVSHLEHHAEGRKGTVERRIGYYSRFGHICMCERCVDPTESGTYSSAIVCEYCRGSNWTNKLSEHLGYLLPDNFVTIGIGSNISWRCNACRKFTQLSKFYPKIEQISIALEENDGKSVEYVSMQAEHFAKSIISEYRDTFLHPNHWLIQKATLILMDESYRSLTSQATNENVQGLLAYCRFMLKILNQIHPGFSILKSRAMIYMSAAITAKMDQTLSATLSEDGSVMESEMKNQTTELLGIKKELIEFFKDDFPVERGKIKPELVQRFENEVDSLIAMQTIFTAIQQNN